MISETEKWSYSRLSTLQQCSYKFKLKYVDGYQPLKSSFNLVRGSLVHRKAQEMLLYFGMNRAMTKDRIAEELARLPEDELDKIKWGFDNEVNRIYGAGNLLARYIRQEMVRKTGKPYLEISDHCKIEENLLFPVYKGNGQVAGYMTTYIDVHYLFENHVIYELKTTSRTPNEGQNFSHIKQAIIYLEALNHMYGEFSESFEYHILYAVMNKTIKIVDIPVTEIDYREDVINELWNLIRIQQDMERTGSYARTLDMNCSWCDYRDLCLDGNEEGYYRKNQEIIFEEKANES